MLGLQFQTWRTEEVLSYLVLVKHKFETEYQMYNEFLDIIKEFRSNSIDGSTARQRAFNLFNGHPELIPGFNAILPHVYRKDVQRNEQVQISIPSTSVDGGATSYESNFHTSSTNTTSVSPTHSSQSNYSFPSSSPHSSTGSTVISAINELQGHQFQKSNVDYARSYLDHVKLKFENQPHVYSEFVDIMERSSCQSIGILEIMLLVSNLLRGHPELIEGFNIFLPLRCWIDVQPNEEINFLVPVMNDGGGATSAQSSLSNIQNNRAIAASIHPTHSPQYNYLNPETSPDSSTGRTTNKVRVIRMQDWASFLDQVKYKFQDQPEAYNKFLSIMRAWGTRSVSPLETVHHLSCLFRGEPELCEAFNAFLPPECRIDIQPTQQVQVNIPGINLSGGATSSPSSLTAFPSRSSPIHPTHSSQSNHSNPTTSQHSSPESIVNEMEKK